MSTHIYRVLARIDRGIDIAIGAGLTVSGSLMVVGFARPKALTDTIHYLATLSWSVVLACGAISILLGSVLRTERPGRRQSFAYGLELGGWAFTFGAVMVYGIANTASHGSAAGNAALFVLAAFLLGRFLHLWLGVQIARREVG